MIAARSDAQPTAEGMAGSARARPRRLACEVRRQSGALFTTWARRFAAVEVPGEIRRRLGRSREIPGTQTACHPTGDAGTGPEELSEADELAQTLVRLIAHKLTVHQGARDAGVGIAPNTTATHFRAALSRPQHPRPGHGRIRATGSRSSIARSRLDGHVELEALGKPASSASSSLGRCALAPHRVPDQPLAAPSEVARSTRGRTPTRCWGFSQPEMGRFTHTEPAMPVRRYEHRQRSTRELKSMPVVTQRCLWRRPLAVVGESARRRPRLKTRRM